MDPNKEHEFFCFPVHDADRSLQLTYNLKFAKINEPPREESANITCFGWNDQQWTGEACSEEAGTLVRTAECGCNVCELCIDATHPLNPEEECVDEANCSTIPPVESECTDTDDGRKDIDGDSCSVYEAGWCGYYDDEDFAS